MERLKTKESQYDIIFDVIEKHGVAKLGLMINESWNQDPKRALFNLAHYKFVSKMLSGKKHVLEVGCADAFGTRLVQQEVGHVTAIDFDPVFINDVNARKNLSWPLDAFVHDITKEPVPGKFDGIYSLDVFEHISPKLEHKFIQHILASLGPDGVVIIGIPSLESQSHASPQSKAGHINCKSGQDFKLFLLKYFKNVFLFSMNDEVVHTGYFPMAHYLLAICTI